MYLNFSALLKVEEFSEFVAIGLSEEPISKCQGKLIARVPARR
jgi:hypothetical protein